jgi:ribonuclease BN (tRNA processing enzyme)
VYAPEGLEKSLASLVSDWGDTFDWHAVGDGDRTTIGGVDLRFSRTDHPPPTCALEATSSAGKRLVYTADTGPRWSVDAFTPGADLVVSEASYLHEHRRSAIHLSAHEAGAAAREANARRLILTHLWPFVDKEAVALEAYGDAVTLAAQGLVTTI